MKRAVAISGAVLVVVVGASALDWFVIGGPIAGSAISRCEEGRKSSDFGDGDPFGENEPPTPHEYCKGAWKRGDLTIRGGIDS